MNKLLGLRVRPLIGTLFFAFAVIALQFSGVQSAHAISTVTWTGTAGDGKFSTASNWSGSTVPTNGDILSFSVTSLSSNPTLNNDLSSLTVSGITFNGTQTNAHYYIISGNTLTLSGNITDSITYSNNFAIPPTIATNIVLASNVSITGPLTFSGSGKTIDTQTHNLSINNSIPTCGLGINPLTGSGALALSDTSSSSVYNLNGNSTGYTGAISINSGMLTANGPSNFGSTSGVTVSGSGTLSLYASADSTWTFPFTLSGSGSIGAQHSGTSSCSGGTDSSTYTATLSGPVTLLSNFIYDGNDNLTITGTYTDNSHSFTVQPGATGILTTSQGAAQAPVVTTDLSGDTPQTNVTVINKETATLDGSRGTVQVNSGGTLKGTGVANSLNIGAGGIVAPGHSPGTLTVLTQYSQVGEYQAELQTKDAYDQIVVSDPSRTTGNDVSLDTNSTLNTVLYDGYSIKTGDTFKIIDNKSGTAVLGTFQGLPEGTQFTVSNVTFSISYVGGDGNDVVLTALTSGSAPSAPNTAVRQFILANPLITLGVGVGAAALLIIVTRKQLRRR